MTEKKSFGISLLIWFFLGGLGGHRIYIKERISIVFYYWIGTVCTFGLLPLFDVFFIKPLIKKANAEQ